MKICLINSIKKPLINFQKLPKVLLFFFLIFTVQVNITYSKNNNTEDDEGLAVTQVQSLNFGTFSAENGGTVKADGSVTGTIFNFGGQMYATFLVTKIGDTADNQKFTFTILDPIQIITRSGGQTMNVSYQILSPSPQGNNSSRVNTRLENGSKVITITGTTTVMSNQTPGIYNGNFEVEVLKTCCD